MSLQPKSRAVPVETARVAKAVYPKGNLYMKLRDELGDFMEDADFAELYPATGQPSLSPSLLALVLIMQYLADYSDRQAAEAVRDQISWKYALGLPLESQGFDYSILSEFRKRLVEAEAQEKIFNLLLARLQAKNLLKGTAKQRTDASHVLARVRNLNRLELLGEALRTCLNRLAELVPTWLDARLPATWYERYAERFNTWHLPKALPERQALVLQIGADGYALLDWLYQDRAELKLGQLSEIEALRQIWIQQFWLDENDAVQLREAKNMPKGSKLIASPFDLEARFSQERAGKAWLGYKSHLTETCDEAAPRLITDVQTTWATEADNQVCPRIQKALLDKGLKPDEHYFDAGYSSMSNLLHSRSVRIEMLSPMRTVASWQSQALKGLGLASFFIDWDSKKVQCPNGKSSSIWSESQNERQKPVIHIRFAQSDCQVCPLKVDCTKASARSLKLYSRDWHEALEAARLQQKTLRFKEKYRIRAGIEGTISMAVRDCDLRHSPFIGLAKTSLHALLVASALNLIRAFNWLDDVPLATTRKSPLAKKVA
jgi:transposase